MLQKGIPVIASGVGMGTSFGEPSWKSIGHSTDYSQTIHISIIQAPYCLQPDPQATEIGLHYVGTSRRQYLAKRKLLITILAIYSTVRCAPAA
jgi:hypothetical protein